MTAWTPLAKRAGGAAFLRILVCFASYGTKTRKFIQLFVHILVEKEALCPF